MPLPTDPAFPAVETHSTDGTQQVKNHLGISIRMEFAKAAMTGLLTSPTTDELSYDDVSDRAIAQADSLLAKLGVQQ